MANDTLLVGVVQTSLDYRVAWNSEASWPDALQISALEETRARKEIRHHLASLRGLDHPPDIVLLPELSVPLGYVGKLEKAAEKLEAIVIAGLDYRIQSLSPAAVSNEAILIVPKKIRGKKIASHTSTRIIGKTYAAPAEKDKLTQHGVSFISSPVVWLFSSSSLGDFGVAVCYDFMDLDRIVLYRNKIQTLFILSYNKDTTSFSHMAEAIARTVFCNVVVCNCGFYGDSLVVSPFREPYRRTVYRHSGQKLPNAQVIELPLEELRLHQTGLSNNTFKSLPPGFTPYSNVIAQHDEI